MNKQGLIGWITQLFKKEEYKPLEYYKENRDKEKVIIFIDDFARLMVGRTAEDHPNNGQKFREEVLLPKLRKATKDDPLVVVLDGADGYGASFLKEAFGGLIAKNHYTREAVDSLIKIEATSFYTVYKRGIELLLDEVEKELAETNKKEPAKAD